MVTLPTVDHLKPPAVNISDSEQADLRLRHTSCGNAIGQCGPGQHRAMFGAKRVARAEEARILRDGSSESAHSQPVL